MNAIIFVVGGAGLAIITTFLLYFTWLIRQRRSVNVPNPNPAAHQAGGGVFHTLFKSMSNRWFLGTASLLVFSALVVIFAPMLPTGSIPVLDFFRTGPVTWFKVVLGMGILFVTGWVIYAVLKILLAEHKWHTRIPGYIWLSLITAVTLLSIVYTPQGLWAIITNLINRRDRWVDPLIKNPDAAKLHEYGFSGTTLLWIGSVVLLILIIAGIATSKDGVKTVGAGLGKLAWPLAFVAAIGLVIWAVATGQINLAEPVGQTKASAVVTPVQRFNFTDPVTLTVADYLTDRKGRLPDLAIKSWSDPVTDFQGSCLDWPDIPLKIESRFGFEGPWLPGNHAGAWQFRFKSQTGQNKMPIVRNSGDSNCS